MVLYQIKSTNPYIRQRVVKSVGGSGFLGRVAIMEMCPINQLISEMISSGTSMIEMRKEAAQQEVFSLYQEGMKQVVLGNMTMEEISKCSHFEAME